MTTCLLQKIQERRERALTFWKLDNATTSHFVLRSFWKRIFFINDLLVNEKALGFDTCVGIIAFMALFEQRSRKLNMTVLHMNMSMCFYIFYPSFPFNAVRLIRLL